MKARSSVDKAQWSNSRESEYRRKCDQILFNKKVELIINANEVYLNSGTDKYLLLKIDKPKSMWYEVWLKLKQV